MLRAFYHYLNVCIQDFSNVISKQDVKVLAEADDQEVVREVQVSDGWCCYQWSLGHVL